MKLIRNLVIIVLIVAAALIGIGFASGASFTDMVDQVSGSEDYVLQDPVIYSESMTELYISLETRDLIIQPTDDAEIKIEYYEKENEIWNIDLTDNTLTITQQNEPGSVSGWFDWVWPWSDVLDVVVSIPSDYQFDVDVTLNTGTVTLSDFDSLHDAYINSNTGSVTVSNITANQLDISVNTGSVNADNIEIVGSMTLISNTGSIEANHLTATNMILEANTGSVEVTYLTAERLSAQAETGSVELEYVTADQIDLSANTGSINVKYVELSQRSMYLHTQTGSVRLNGSNKGTSYQVVYDNTFYLNAEANTGSVTIQE